MPEFNDSYEFSDYFDQFLDRAMVGQHAPDNEPEYEVDEPEPKPEEEAEPEETEDWKSKYESLQEEYNTLKEQADHYPDMNNEDVQNDDFLREMYAENTGHTALLDMVMRDDYAASNLWDDDASLPSSTVPISGVQTKSSNVRINSVDNKLGEYINTLPEDVKKKIVVTSGNDQEHAPNSKHYRNQAIDLRYLPEVHNFIKNDPLAQKMGIKVLNPNHGTAKHTHVEIRAYGGKYKV